MSERSNELWALLAKDYLQEKKRKRQWGIVFKSLYLAVLAVIFYGVFSSNLPSDDFRSKPHTALVNVRGTIFDMADSNADAIAQSLRNAYKNQGTRAIILRINSPGGSPVQADYIYREVVRLKKLHPKIKVYAVCTDMCASAAYYIAAAADEIYANPATLVGSIGVLYNGFGFVDAMHKLGVERRLVTAGSNKGFMDPFSPLQPAQKEELQAMLKSIHEQFIQRVREGRGARLQSSQELFSGLVWTGDRAKALGLIDGFGSAGSVARDIVKQAKIYDYTVKPHYIERILKQVGSEMMGRLVTDLTHAKLY